jgi:SNF2 family DNA or RNA helicase
MLTSLPADLPEGLRIDDSVRYWLEVTKLLLEFLTRGRFVPGLFREYGSWRAYWHLVPKGEDDTERLSFLAKQTPPLCRGLPRRRNQTGTEPSALLESFASECVDNLIRAFLSRHDMFAQTDREKISPRLRIQVNWLEALCSLDSRIEGPEYELMKFEERLRNWSGGTLTVVRAHEIVTCLRLIAPEDMGKPVGDSLDVEDVEDHEDGDLGEEETGTDDEAEWLLEFVLQSTAQSGHELSAAQIWKGDLGFLHKSDLTVEELEERLLKDLGRAKHVFEPLRRALRSTHPTHLKLTTAEAYEFLKTSAEPLVQMDLKIDLPNWWTENREEAGLRLHVDADDFGWERGVRFNFLATNALLDFKWDIALGDTTVSVDTFRELVNKNVPLIQVAGKWVELDPKKLASTIQFLDRQKDVKQISFAEAMRLGLGIEQPESTLPVLQFSANGWVEQLLHASTKDIPRLTEPDNFKGDLREYQRDGLTWLTFLSRVGIGGCLADDMGLGKTIQFLALLQHEKELALSMKEAGAVSHTGPTLLVVPMSILSNWEQEATKFTPNLKSYVHHGTSRFSGEGFLKFIEDIDIIITTYSLVHRDYEILRRAPWIRIALDEAQNIKNLEAKQTQAVRRLALHCASENPHLPCQRLALTGTPLENHLEELWSIFDFLNPNLLGSLKQFRTRFVLPIERYRDKKSSEALARLIQPFVLRRLKSDPKIIEDLPEKMEMEVFTSLTNEQATLYQSVVDEMLTQVGAASGMHRKGLVLATITKLKQICNHPALMAKDGSLLPGRSGKLNRLEELIEVILAEKDRVLIFTQFAQMGHLLKPYLQERFNTEVLFFHGAMSKRAREKTLEQFRAPTGPSIFLLSLKAGGLGLNLTEANQVVHFDQWWNPAVQEQATDRAYRIGQTRAVQVRTFICKGTLEEKINEMLRHKKALADQIVGSSKKMITQLSMDELRELISLTGQTQ